MYNPENLINTYLAFIIHHIDYSLSGAQRNIMRRNDKPYTFSNSNKETYAKLVRLFDSYNYQEAIKLMFNEHLGDCWDQAFVLAMMLKITPSLNKEFNIYIASSNQLPSTQQHSFVLLVKRRTEIHQLYAQLSLTIKGQALLNQENIVLIADPWADKIFSPITSENHPFKSLDFANIELLIQNVDKCFMQFQREFPTLYLDLFTNYLENLTRMPGQLKEVIKGGQFELALRRASVSDKFFPIVKALVDFHEILNINIQASGSAGTARDIARKFNCDQIMSYLDNYQSKSEAKEFLSNEIQTAQPPCFSM